MKTKEKSNIEFAIDHQSKLIFENFRGSLSLHEVFEAQKQKTHLPEYNNDYAVVTDLSESEFLFNEFDLIRAINLIQKKQDALTPKTKTAVVAKTTNQFEMALLYKVFSPNNSSSSFRIFNSKDASLDWLL